MKNRLIPCVLACLMIFLVGCNGNTAKEAAQEITKTETSFPAGNTETDSQEETAEEPESTTVQEETPITAEESQSTAERQTVATVQTKPAEDKTAETPVTEKTKAEPPKQTTTQAEPENQPEQPKEQTTAEPNPVEKPTEKPAEPEPTEPPKQTFDVSPYVSYAQEYYNRYSYMRVGDLPLEDIVNNYKGYGLPCFETIRRARQRVQSLFPELSRQCSGCDCENIRIVIEVS